MAFTDVAPEADMELFTGVPLAGNPDTFRLNLGGAAVSIVTDPYSVVSDPMLLIAEGRGSTVTFNMLHGDAGNEVHIVEDRLSRSGRAARAAGHAIAAFKYDLLPDAHPEGPPEPLPKIHAERVQLVLPSGYEAREVAVNSAGSMHVNGLTAQVVTLETKKGYISINDVRAHSLRAVTRQSVHGVGVGISNSTVKGSGGIDVLACRGSALLTDSETDRLRMQTTGNGQVEVSRVKVYSVDALSRQGQRQARAGRLLSLVEQIKDPIELRSEDAEVIVRGLTAIGDSVVEIDSGGFVGIADSRAYKWNIYSDNPSKVSFDQASVQGIYTLAGRTV